MRQTKSDLLLASSGALDTGDPIRFPLDLQVIPIYTGKPLAHFQILKESVRLRFPLTGFLLVVSRHNVAIWNWDAILCG